jgi:tetratricopeptide (TPR) repeat protein
MGMSGTTSESDNQAARSTETLALGAASRDRADAFLAEQTALTRLTIERETRDEKLRGWRQLVEHVSGVMKLVFDSAVALVVIVITAAIVAALWNAGHANGLVIEAFSVPPDLANKGLTGDVVAGKVLDRLAALQAATNSNRAQSSYVNNWGNDIKVQIPETGVSIGQTYQYLVRWLGNEQHISGDIYRENGQLAVTSRIGGDSSETQHGTEDKLDDLITRAAESVYRRTQPYRYAVYLDNHNRVKEAQAIYRALIAGKSLDDRAWAYIGMSSERSGVGDMVGAAELLRHAIATRPGILLSYENLQSNEGNLQHDEAQLIWLKRAMEIQANGADPSMNPEDFAFNVLANKATLAGTTGDFQAQLRFDRQLAALPLGNGSANNAANQRTGELQTCAALHDRECYDAVLATLPVPDNPLVRLNREGAVQAAAAPFEDWDAVIKPGDFVVGFLKKVAPLGQMFLQRGEYPLLAAGYAGKGDFAKAHALIDPTPLDCAICLRIRGQIATMERNWPAADRWYARAVHDTPSTPFAAEEWGSSLLRRGDFAGAIAKFAQANHTGPRYADPLEGWGEALIATNRSDLALAKFQEAARYAPNWGRLHLKWGQALLWLGDRTNARVHFITASGLYLSPTDRATVNRLITAG